MDSGSKDHICNNFESFDSIKFLNESISVANSLSIRILGQGIVKLLCKCPNRNSPFLLKLGNVYFIPRCTVNLVLTFQLSTKSIVFDSKIPCLKQFGKTKILCTVTQIHRYYTLDAIPKTKSEFMEFTRYDNYLILDPLEHQLLVWH